MTARRVPIDELGPWLLQRPLGEVALLAGGTAESCRIALADVAPPANGRLGLVCTPAVAAPADRLVRAIAGLLGEAARAAYPHWYGSEALAGLGHALLDETLIEGRLRHEQRRLPDLFLPWARPAVLRARRGQAAHGSGLPLEVELRQLVLALAPAGLTLIAVVSGDGTDLPATIAGLEWLARWAHASVVAAIEDSGLAAVSDRLATFELSHPSSAPTIDDVAQLPAPWAGPIQGRPHWASRAEQAFAQAIGEDDELRGRFGFNLPAPTVRGTRYRVDLLWSEGRLVVEIDGYPDHTTSQAFRRDRQRDYELLISGYVVLRLTAEEVLNDVSLAVDKLRDAVRYRESQINRTSP